MVKITVKLFLLISQAKCARYWPKVGMSAEFDEIVIDNMLEHDKGEYIVRELRLYQKERVSLYHDHLNTCLINPFAPGFIFT